MAKKQKNDAGAKERIFKAAIEEFIEYGYYGARTQRIADSAKVNKALLHYYFGSKEKVYSEVLNTVADEVVKNLSRISDEPVPVEKKLEQIMDAYIKIFTEHHNYVRLLVYEVIRGGEHMKKVIMSHIRDFPMNPVTGKLYKYFEQQMKAGKIRKVNIFHLFLSAVVQVAPVYFAKTIAGGIFEGVGLDRIVLDRFVAERKDFVLKLMMEGLRKD